MIQNQKTEQGYREDLNSISSVEYAQFELQHPGVPWNNNLVVFVVMDIQDGGQVAKTLQAIRTINEHYMKKATSTSIYVVSADKVRIDQYDDRSIYFKDFYLGDEQNRETFQQAAKSVGMKPLDNAASY